jgi:hypothetical protein
MEKPRSKRNAKRRPHTPAAPLGLIWDNFKFSVKAFFKRRPPSKPAVKKSPMAAPEDSPG